MIKDEDNPLLATPNKRAWNSLDTVDWTKHNQYHIDTRDFHVSVSDEIEVHKDITKLKKYQHFFFTEEKLVSIINRLYLESGGEGEWRQLNLQHSSGKVTGWNLKYLRIYRTELGFIVTNSQGAAVSWTELDSKVDQKYLHKH